MIAELKQAQITEEKEKQDKNNFQKNRKKMKKGVDKFG